MAANYAAIFLFINFVDLSKVNISFKREMHI